VKGSVPEFVIYSYLHPSTIAFMDLLHSTSQRLQFPTVRNLVSGATACTRRYAGEEEFFAAIHCGPILPDLAEGFNRQVLPAFSQFWRNAEGRLADLWRPARQCARSGAVLRWAAGTKRPVPSRSSERRADFGVQWKSVLDSSAICLAVPVTNPVTHHEPAGL
jgi:hypothetical protein